MLYIRPEHLCLYCGTLIIQYNQKSWCFKENNRDVKIQTITQAYYICSSCRDVFSPQFDHITYCTWKILLGEKLANLGNRETNFFSSIFTDTQKTYMVYALTVAYSPNVSSPNFSLPIAFTCMVHHNFPHQIFPVYCIVFIYTYCTLFVIVYGKPEYVVTYHYANKDLWNGFFSLAACVHCVVAFDFCEAVATNVFCHTTGTIIGLKYK